MTAHPTRLIGPCICNSYINRLVSGTLKSVTFPGLHVGYILRLEYEQACINSTLVDGPGCPQTLQCQYIVFPVTSDKTLTTFRFVCNSRFTFAKVKSTSSGKPEAIYDGYYLYRSAGRSSDRDIWDFFCSFR